MKKTLFVIIYMCIVAACQGGTYSGGLGTSDDPYFISEPNDLLELSTTSSDWSMHFVMTNDIVVLPGSAYLTESIGDGVIYFVGTFDGGGFAIQDLRLTGDSYNALFGYTGAGAQIVNLGLKDARSENEYYVVMLVGNNGGLVNNCYTTGTVSGQNHSMLGGLVAFNIPSGTISNSYSTCNVFTITSHVHIDSLGGLVGSNAGTINNCYASGSVFGLADMVMDLGGLVGSNSGTISNCYATGPVAASENPNIGGLVGFNSGTISDCYAAGHVQNFLSGDGGLVGFNIGTIDDTSFWNTETSGQPTSAGGGTGITTAQMKTLTTFTSAPANWDFSTIWQMQEGESFPYLRFGIGAPEPVVGDIDGDGDVDFNDFALMAANWLEGT